MDALGGETCKVQVTNYDSHDFKAGSFYSDPGAAGSPVTGHSFTGFCTPAVVSAVSTTNMFIEVRDMDDFSAPPAVYVRQKKNNVWNTWMVPATGGSDPNFSGVIRLNNKPALSSPVPNTSTSLTGWDGVPAVSVIGNNNILSSNEYRAQTHSFLTRDGATTFATMSPSNFTLNVATVAGSVTAVAPSLADSSTRVPTTSWVRSAVSELILSTPGFPRASIVSDVGPGGIPLSYAGKHVYRRTSALTGTVTLSNNGWTEGMEVMLVNLGAQFTITSNLGNQMYLAGRANASNPGNVIMSGSAASIATIMLLEISSGNGIWIVHGSGLT
jgi:hypothetical protein